MLYLISATNAKRPAGQRAGARTGHSEAVEVALALVCSLREPAVFDALGGNAVALRSAFLAVQFDGRRDLKGR